MCYYCTVSDNNSKPSRGRPRKFDEQVVIEHAARVFLECGYEALSYERLAVEVGLSKPSLYNTFGDKSALFERVLSHYADQALALSAAHFENKKTLKAATKAFLVAAADIYSEPSALSRGCLLIGTALPACTQADNVRGILKSFIQSLERGFEDTITVRFKDDAQNLGRSPRALALQLSSSLFALAIRARTGMSHQELRKIAMELAHL